MKSTLVFDQISGYLGLVTLTHTVVTRSNENVRAHYPHVEDSFCGRGPVLSSALPLRCWPF